MNFTDYYLRTLKPNKYRIKTIAVIDDAEMDIIEKVLMRFEPTDISRPKKSIIQDNPADFVGVNYAEVYTIDFVTTVPVSDWELRRVLSDRLGVPDKYLIVKSQYDPLADEPVKDEVEGKEQDLVGDTRVSKLLKAVSEVEGKNKKEIEMKQEDNLKFSLLNTFDQDKK